MNNCMIDLETLSTRPGGVVLSIGAVMFDENGVGDAAFYGVLAINAQTDKGAHVSPDTVAWWHKQSESAREVLREAERMSIQPPSYTEGVLKAFCVWWKEAGAKYVWGNGAAFDDPILTETFRLFGLSAPWKFWDSRCHRTLKEMFPDIKAPAFEGTAHNALADARHQARHAAAILSHLRDLRMVGKYSRMVRHEDGRVTPDIRSDADRAFDNPHHGHGDEGMVRDSLSVGDAIAKIRKGGTS